MNASDLWSSDTARRLAKVLQLLDSPHDGEVLAAARRAIGILRQSGTAPEDLANRLLTPPPRAYGGSVQERVLGLEAQIASLKETLKTAKAELSHWQNQAWAAASLVAELEDALSTARREMASRTASMTQTFPRTQAEKRVAIITMLNDPKSAALSDRELARRLGLSPQTIGNWRRRLNAKLT